MFEHMTVKEKEERKKKMVQEYNAGDKIEVIALRYNVSYSTVIRALPRKENKHDVV